MTFLEFLSNIPDIEAESEAALLTHQLARGPWLWARERGKYGARFLFVILCPSCDLCSLIILC